MADVDCIASWLVARDDVAGDRVGITGFCMGGRIAYLGAAHCERIGASIMYYPTRLVTSEARGGSEARPPIDDIDKVRVPILGFFPTLDPDALLAGGHRAGEAGVRDGGDARRGDCGGGRQPRLPRPDKLGP